MERTYDEPRVIALADIHQSLPFSSRTAYRLAKDKRLRTIRIAGRLYVPRSEIDRILTEGTERVIEDSVNG